jgi:hypothetical protein
MRHMMRHEAKGPPRPLPEDSVTRAFEKVAFTKVVRALARASSVQACQHSPVENQSRKFKR